MTYFVSEVAPFTVHGAGTFTRTFAGYEPVPVVWTQDGDDWAATEQPQLVGRLDFEMRGLAMATDRDGDGTGLRAIVTGWGVDVEQWEWHGGA